MPETRKSQSDKAKDPEKVAAEAAAEAEPSEDAEAFPVERLIEESSDFLGFPTHVAAGGLEGIAKKSLTVEEAKAAIKAWLKAPVKEA